MGFGAFPRGRQRVKEPACSVFSSRGANKLRKLLERALLLKREEELLGLADQQSRKRHTLQSLMKLLQICAYAPHLSGPPWHEQCLEQ
jgi:hypothetical protein